MNSMRSLIAVDELEDRPELFRIFLYCSCFVHPVSWYVRDRSSVVRRGIASIAMGLETPPNGWLSTDTVSKRIIRDRLEARANEQLHILNASAEFDT
jgi:hypothetical protein